MEKHTHGDEKFYVTFFMFGDGVTLAKESTGYNNSYFLRGNRLMTPKEVVQYLKERTKFSPSDFLMRRQLKIDRSSERKLLIDRNFLDRVEGLRGCFRRLDNNYDDDYEFRLGRELDPREYSKFDSDVRCPEHHPEISQNDNKLAEIASKQHKSDKEIIELLVGDINNGERIYKLLETTQ
jgi:hypothetical protein